MNHLGMYYANMAKAQEDPQLAAEYLRKSEQYGLASVNSETNCSMHALWDAGAAYGSVLNNSEKSIGTPSTLMP